MNQFLLETVKKCIQSVKIFLLPQSFVKNLHEKLISTNIIRRLEIWWKTSLKSNYINYMIIKSIVRKLWCVSVSHHGGNHSVTISPIRTDEIESE